MFRTLFSRLMVTYFIIILVTLTILSLLLSTYFKDYIFNSRKEELIREGKELSPYISLYAMGLMDENSLYSIFQSIDRYKNTTIWVTDLFGNIWIPYSSTGENEKWKEQKINAEEFVQVLKGNIITKIGRFGERFPVPVLTVGVPLVIRDRIRGAILLHSPVEEINTALYEIYRNIWLAAFISASLSVILLYWISRRISQPLTQMNEISKEFSRGDFRRRVKVTNRDEIGQLSANFNFMADSLEKLEEMRTRFVANVSHELRSPLTSIQGYIQGVLDGTISAEEQQKYLSVALSESQRLSKLINELLDLSWIESGEFPLNRSVFDVNEQILRILVAHEEKIEKKSMDVNIDFENQHCWVEADPDRIQQVIINLVDNAIKFNKESGTIHVKTWREKNTIFIRIQDEGIGIPKEDIDHIWERFYQVDKTRSPKRQGSGLGLSIVKKIIEQHNQKIWVESKLGEGTSFTFSLKAAEHPGKNTHN